MRLSAAEVERRRKMLEMPVDFDSLIEAGVLAQQGAWYRVLDPDRVPEHLWVQIGGPPRVEDGQLVFRFSGR